MIDIVFERAAAKHNVVVLCTSSAEKLADFAALLGEDAVARIRRAAEEYRFKFGEGQILDCLSGETGRAIVVGLGTATPVALQTVERAGAHAIKHLLCAGVEDIVVATQNIEGSTPAAAAAALATGAQLAAYRFDAYRRFALEAAPHNRITLKRATIIAMKPDEARAEWARAKGTVEGALWARDLVSEPANVLFPAEFARRIERLRDVGVNVTIVNAERMHALGMGALLGVGRGSEYESLLVVMEWRGGEGEPVVLLGKGVTFDTGGVSIKAADGMQDMKADMGGAAAIAGAMHAIASRRSAANVVGIVGLVENATDAKAQRPGDIVTSMSGKTIEIINTDAEGRLVLCDAIEYAQSQFRPRALIDLATLTGNVMLALGYRYAGLFSNNDDLARAIADAGQDAGEPLWRLPLGSHYDKTLDSTFADMKNGAGRLAGAITAAQFLQRFVREGTPWAHIDMAGTVQVPSGDFKNDDPRLPAWATGWGVRLLDRLVASHFETA